MAEKFKGTIRWFNNSLGFGFLNSEDEPDKDIFVHYSGINCRGYKTLEEGQKVEFEIEDGKKGPQAVKVVGLE